MTMKKEEIIVDLNKLSPSKINDLTEIEMGYKLMSTNLTDFYNGLHPPLLSKLAASLFSAILSNKMYKKTDAHGYNEDEARRIFSTIMLQPSDIAKRLNPVKYATGENGVENDISNLLKRVDELEEMNIFYVWKFRSPYTYVFVMERDVASWKYYNPKGVLYPKGIKKILRLSKVMIETMESLERQRERHSERKDIEKSFGEFINKLIGKMNPEVAAKIVKYTEDKNIFSFISDALGTIKKMGDHEGYEYDDLFINRLPEHIRKKIVKTNKEMIVNIEEMMELEKDLVPNNSNLIKLRGIAPKRTKATGIISEKSQKTFDPERVDTQVLDPFKNPHDMTKFYRSFLRLYNKDAKFYDFSFEVSVAEEILDILIKNGKSNDIKFLKAWIRFYVTTNLKGNGILRQDKTTLKEFVKTFGAYSKIHLG